jgi:hypothetical protein
MAMAICAKLVQLGVRDRVVHLYDTFEGMTAPTEADTLIVTGARPNMSDPNVLVHSPLDRVKRNLSLIGYPEEMIRYHVGDITRVAAEDVPERIAFLRLDTDWYESTKFELEVFVPRVSAGGVVAQDDYGWWSGATKAVDEHLARQAPHPATHKLSPHGIWWVSGR